MNVYEYSLTATSGYDVSPDGQFLMVQSSPTEQPGMQINVVVNWLEELKRQVPALPYGNSWWPSKPRITRITRISEAIKQDLRF
jgi:hypothetical protein